MNEYIDLGADKLREPIYFYTVSEFMTTFGKDEGKREAFTVEQDFKCGLKEAREKAIKYFNERRQGAENGSYFLPFSKPDNFEFGKNAAFSITMFLVEYYNDENIIMHPIAGEDEDDIIESLKIEKAVFAERYNID